MYNDLWTTVALVVSIGVFIICIKIQADIQEGTDLNAAGITRTYSPVLSTTRYHQTTTLTTHQSNVSAGNGYTVFDFKHQIEPTLETQPIIALRLWRLHDLVNGVVLRSWYSETLWPYASELIRDEEHSGIHAFKTAESLFDYAHTRINADDTIIGTVALWGEGIEYECGYVAEKAYPRHLLVRNKRHAQLLRNAYGCDISIVEDYTPTKQFAAKLVTLVTHTTTQKGNS